MAIAGSAPLDSPPSQTLIKPTAAGVAVYSNWLEEVTFRAAKLVGWPMERIRASDFITLQYRHDAEFFDAARSDDEIEISSRLIEVRHRRGRWIHEIRRAGATRS